jgi:hypothetical protein
MSETSGGYVMYFQERSGSLDSEIAVSPDPNRLFQDQAPESIESWYINVERISPYGPRQVRYWLPPEYVASLLQTQQASPFALVPNQRLVGNIAKVAAQAGVSALAYAFPKAPERQTTPLDPYSTARESATRLVSISFGASGEDWAGTRVRLLTARSSPPSTEKISAYSPSETWNDEDDQRFAVLAEKEALGALDSGESDELERLSGKRDRIVAQVSNEELAKERERGKALSELQNLLEKYAPLFAKPSQRSTDTTR